jgi:tRNA1(Val) A37 N6-methylase TrmN6
MILEFSEDLKKQNIYANGLELVQILGMDTNLHCNRITTRSDFEQKLVASFNDPVLLTDNYRIGLLDHIKRDTVFALYSSSIKKIIYDHTSITFEQKKYPGVWGPSIDTILLCKSLKHLKDTNQLDDVRYATEIGSGSGFISKYVLEHNSKIKQMDLVDISPLAINCAKNNIFDSRMNAVQITGIEYLLNKKFDLILSNPPYVPRMTTVEDNPYEGIGLLSDLITKGKNSLTKNGMLLLNISSVCENNALKLIKDENLKYDKIDSLDVPLKILRILNNPEWFAYLKENFNSVKNNTGYDFWQTISIYKITK